jgi:GcrA cell cycle regulator
MTDDQIPEWMRGGRLQKARALWDDGIGVTEIARRIGHGCTRDALIGKAHRLGWPPHPHPPQYGGRGNRKVERQAERRTERREGRKAATPPRVACEPQRLGVPTATFSRCQWPITEIPPHRFCDAVVAGTGPYCEQHRARSRERRPSVRDAWVSAA